MKEFLLLTLILLRILLSPGCFIPYYLLAFPIITLPPSVVINPATAAATTTAAITTTTIAPTSTATTTFAPITIPTTTTVSTTISTATTTTTTASPLTTTSTTTTALPTFPTTTTSTTSFNIDPREGLEDVFKGDANEFVFASADKNFNMPNTDNLEVRSEGVANDYRDSPDFPVYIYDLGNSDASGTFFKSYDDSVNQENTNTEIFRTNENVNIEIESNSGIFKEGNAYVDIRPEVIAETITDTQENYNLGTNYGPLTKDSGNYFPYAEPNNEGFSSQSNQYDNEQSSVLGGQQFFTESSKNEFTILT